MNVEKTIEEISHRVFDKLCVFYGEHMIQVPIVLRDVISKEVRGVIEKNCSYAISSIDQIFRKSIKCSPIILKVLLDGDVTTIWTIHKLSMLSSCSASVVHKMKHRLLYLKVVKLVTPTRFCLTEEGKEKLRSCLISN